MRSNAHVSLGFDMSEITLGTEIKRRRGERSLSQLAVMTGITKGTLSRIENGQIDLPSRETLASLSRALEIPMSYLAQLAYGEPPYVAATSPVEERALTS